MTRTPSTFAVPDEIAEVSAGAQEGREAVVINYRRDGSELVRHVTTLVGGGRSHLGDPVPEVEDPAKAWALARRRGARPVYDRRAHGRVRTVDLFSGAGGMASGVAWAIEAIGRKSSPTLAVDVDAEALKVHEFNHLPRKAYVGSVRDLFTATEVLAANDPAAVEPRRLIGPGAEWIAGLGTADLVFGGPPCQGHSNLNNRTRRTDDRNQLYLWMALAARAFQAKAVIIENVASVKADAGDVVGTTLSLLETFGYQILFDEVISADNLGVPQSRRRHFAVAVREDLVAPMATKAMDWLRTVAIEPITLMEAIGDLEDVSGAGAYDSASKLSSENQRRIDHLFDEDLYDLPDEERPLSHRDGHTYPSVYGRMYPDKQAGTISTGFLTPGRGRYVHPTRRRTMTLHEGARVQGFPDDFRFVRSTGDSPSRTAVARMIGDAVPPPMAFHVAIATLGCLRADALDRQ